MAQGPGSCRAQSAGSVRSRSVPPMGRPPARVIHWQGRTHVDTPLIDSSFSVLSASPTKRLRSSKVMTI